MPTVKPATPRHRVEEDLGILRVIIPSARSLFSMFPSALWLGVWAVVVVAFVAGTLFAEDASQLDSCFLVWILFWLAFGAIPGISLLWQLAGREILEAREASVSIRREVFGIGRTLEYAADHVRDIRPVATTFPFGLWMRYGAFSGFGQGSLAFDYGARTIRFGAGVDEAEAKMIAEAVNHRFPKYAPRREP